MIVKTLGKLFLNLLYAGAKSAKINIQNALKLYSQELRNQ